MLLIKVKSLRNKSRASCFLRARDLYLIFETIISTTYNHNSFDKQSHYHIRLLTTENLVVYFRLCRFEDFYVKKHQHVTDTYLRF